MADDYTIRARITADDATGAGVRGARRSLETVEEKARSVSSNISSMLGRAFLLLGGATGIGFVVRGLVGMNAEIDEATRGLAGMFTAFTGTPIERSFRVARLEIQGLREDARKGVGELSDYIKGYQFIAGVGLPAGLGLDRIRELNKNAIAAGFALRGQEGMQLATLDVVQAVTGGAHDRTTPIAMAALRAAGTADSFNATKDQAKRLEILNAAFGTFGPSVELMGKSWNAQAGTFRDNLRSILILVTKPLFDEWIDRLRRANLWLEANKDTVAEIATKWGDRLLTMWDNLIERAGTYAAIVASAAVVQMLPAGGGRGGIGTTAANAWQNARFLGANAGGGLAGLRAGAGGFLEVLGPVLGRLALPLTVITTGFLALQGAFAEFPGSLAFLMSGWTFLMESFGTLGGAFASLTEKGSALNSVGVILAGLLGGIAFAVGGVVRIFSSLVIVMGFLFQVLRDGLERFKTFLLTGDFAPAPFEMRVENLMKDLSGVWTGGPTTGGGFQTIDEGYGQSDNEDSSLNGHKTGGNTYIENVHVYPTIEQNGDPARVLTMFEEVATHLTKFKRTGSRNPVLMG